MYNKFIYYAFKYFCVIYIFKIYINLINSIHPRHILFFVDTYPHCHFSLYATLLTLYLQCPYFQYQPFIHILIITICSLQYIKLPIISCLKIYLGLGPRRAYDCFCPIPFIGIHISSYFYSNIIEREKKKTSNWLKN